MRVHIQLLPLALLGWTLALGPGCIFEWPDECESADDCPARFICDTGYCVAPAEEGTGGDCAFTCANGSCVDTGVVCNGNQDCDDGSDELNCNPPACPGQYQCRSGECVVANAPCDGANDCHDLSDEFGCGPCGIDQYQCELFTAQCIDEVDVCDGVPDCFDFTDELFCAPCNNYSCGDGTCLELLPTPDFPLCDGFLDCATGSDEGNCFQCGNGVVLFPTFLCDQIDNCGNGADEIDCGI